MSDAPLMRCADCGRTTRQRTVGTPDGSCPARDPIYATHRWRVIDDE